MELLNENVAYLSNYEVFNILKDIKAKKRQKSRSQLATVTYETLLYLEELPCKDQTPDKIRNFLKAVEPFNLTKCEKLTLINLCPQRPLDIQLIVEASEERLTEEQVDELLQIVATHLGDPMDIKEEPEPEEQE